jgi:hypothetical protein
MNSRFTRCTLVLLVAVGAGCRGHRRGPAPVERSALVVVVERMLPASESRGGGPRPVAPTVDPMVDVGEVARARCASLRACGAQTASCTADVTRRLASSWNVLRCSRVDGPRYAACLSALRTQGCSEQETAPGTIPADCTAEALCVDRR